MTSTRWVFTLNNYTSDEYQLVCDQLSTDQVTYGVVGRETGASGTPHLQGFVIFESNKRLSGIRSFLGARGHYERARGTSAQARDYCRKDGDFTEFGTFPAAQGRRTDLDELLDWMRTFEQEKGRPPASPDFAKHQPKAYLRYPRLARLSEHRAQPRQLEFGEPKPWQLELSQDLEEEADDRTIIFYVDPEGGIGKSWFQRWYMTKNPDLTQILGIGKRDDIAFAIDVSRSVFFFNIPRGQSQFIQYSIFEQLKDRNVFSNKYMSSSKIFNHNNHVVVFMNEHPDMNAMSADRYIIRTVDEED